MTIVVEDGTRVVGANSYVSEAELTAYATARGVTLVTAAEQLLIKAMDYLEGLYYKGIKSTISQPLQWPRINVWIDGYYVPALSIPQQLKNAQMALAVSIDAGDNPLATLSQAVVREKVDVIEVEYAAGSTASPIIKSVNLQLAKLLGNGSGGNVISVYKG